MASSSHYQEAKICLLGVKRARNKKVVKLNFPSQQDMGVGKSSLVGRFVHDKFDTSLTTTLG